MRVLLGVRSSDNQPLRCAYCHAPVGPDPIVCQLCSTQVHSDCADALTKCPTLGCGSRLPEAAPAFSWLRTTLGVSLLAAAVLWLYQFRLHCEDPACMRGMRGAVQDPIYAFLVGVPGLLLLAPPVRRWPGRFFEVAYTIIGALCLFSIVPALVLSSSHGALDTGKRFEIDWFSYSMTWRSFGEGIQRDTFPSVHSVLLAVLIAHALWWGRRRLRAAVV